jgi:hypothetical protein
VLLVTLLLTAFGTGQSAAVPDTAPVPPASLLPDDPPRPQVVARRGALQLQLPIAQPRVTAIAYHGAGAGAVALDPVGRRGNRSLLQRLSDRVFGRSEGEPVYYELGGGGGPPTSALDVGAAPGTDVFSPVEGTVVGISSYVLNREPYGVRVDLQPTAEPSLIVSITRLLPDPSLSVGSTVTAAGSRIGTVLDLSGVERQALARYTQDAGNHVSIEVHPAPALDLP